MKKPIIRILLSVLLVAVVAVGGTLAYLVASDSPLLNTFTLMRIDTEIEEPGEGTAIQKTPKVKNTGTAGVYVRAYAYVVIVDNETKEEYIDPELSAYVEPNYTTGTWQLAEDGYYYYEGKLAPGETTTQPLFDGVTVNESMPHEVSFRVYVYQESALVPADDGLWNLQNAQNAFTAQAQAD